MSISLTFSFSLLSDVSVDAPLTCNPVLEISHILYNLEILLTYNNKMVSSATKMTPLEARKKKNEFEVKLNISLQAKRNRTYPEVEVGDSVKTMRKKGISEKERNSHWVRTPQKIKRIDKKLGQNYYYLESNDKREYLRHELRKV